MWPRRKTAGSAGAQVAALAPAVGVFGVSFGALAVTAGLEPWLATAMSLLVFAGGAQFAAVGVIASGGTPAAAVASGLLLNTRFAAFGLAMAPHLRGGRLRRGLAAFFVIDEAVALALARARDGDDAERVYWLSGFALGVAWIGGTLAGSLAVGAIGDPATYGLDAAFPAGFAALLAPLMRDRRAVASAAGGALIAIGLLPLVAPGIPVLAASAGVLVGLAVPRGRRRLPAEGGS